MYLSDIEIIGFKSFASKTKLQFTDGLSALVGPNGSGKTNIVDAIRWVLGEKKASVLRSEVMENVIFNGSKERKPHGMAEVTLKIQNNRSILPTEYNEVAISRRLYRSGESEYYLNKTLCRLRDIQNLFMDTGVGSDTYSVIELKMVEALLSGKSEERRSMFEEAAGIKKYKLRRKEAYKKLENLDSELERINDIVFEVQKNVNSLSRQAAKTKRYNKLSSELKSTELFNLKYSDNQLKSKINEISTIINELKESKAKLETQSDLYDKEVTTIKEKLLISNQNFKTADDELNTLQAKLAETEKTIAVTSERLSALSTNKAKYEAEKNSAVKRNEDLNQSLIKQQESLAELKLLAEEIKEEIEAKKNESKARQTELSAQRDKYDEINSKIIDLQSQKQSLNSILQKAQLKRQSIQSRINDTKNKLESLINKLENQREQYHNLKNETGQYDNNIKSLENQLSESSEKREKLQSQLNEYNEHISKLNAEVNSRRSMLTFLESLTESEESIKFLKSTKSNFTSQEKVLLAESVGVDEQFRVAVDAALGAYAKYFVVDTRQEALNAIEELSSDNKGKAGFICRELAPALQEFQQEQEISGVFGYISEIVRVDDALRNILRAIIGKTLIVNNYETAQKVLLDKIADLAITLKGEILTNKGWLRGGSVEKNEGVFVGRKERITKLNKELNELNSKITEFRDNSQKVKAEISLIDLERIRKELRNAEQLKALHSKKIAEQELSVKSLENNIELQEQTTTQLQNELSELTDEDTGINDSINKLETALIEYQKEKTDNHELLRSRENYYNNAQALLKQNEMKLVQANSDINNKSNDIKRLESEIIAVKRKIEFLSKDIDTSDSNNENFQNSLNSLREVHYQLRKEIDETSNKTDILEDEINKLNESRETYQNQLNRIRAELDNVKEKIHYKELELSEHKVKLESISKKLEEDYTTEEIEVIIPEDFDFTEAQSIITDIKTKLIALGNVNFLALEEFEQQNSRLEFYLKQILDLTTSRDNLNETINEINTAAENAFSITFEQVRNNFLELFQVLFGLEGEADIRLAEGNMLESDIDIMAKPPHKKPHSIEMLSGGEKTLTAIALLFAIYLVKPSPFCILDEVDAPLDDTSIDKFVNLLKRFSEQTQFMIVTHNKRTMEACDTLYGITMEEEGVSKVVSVQLNSENIS